MTKIHLLIDDDYVDTFMTTLPKDHVRIIEENFEENKILLQQEFDKYIHNNGKFTPHYENMKVINNWLNKKGK